MATIAHLLTVEDFMALPQPAAGARQELHHGALVKMPPVKHLHPKAQRMLMEGLRRVLQQQYLVEKEFPFRPLPQYEAWIADVAVVDRARDQATPDDDYFRGVPEIVMEVLSPSNTASEMLEREAICLRHGGLEFWLCDPVQRTVKVTTAAGQSRIYGVGDTLTLAGFGDAVTVESLFGDD